MKTSHRSSKNEVKIFVTGANGFIGQALVSYLASRGYHVFALLRKGKLPSFPLHQNIEIVYGDLTNKQSLFQAIPSNSYVINLAANPYHKKLSYIVNVHGTQSLLEICKQKKIKKIIHISSQATKIQHKGVYASTKILADELVISSKLPYTIVKPSLVYGPGEKGLFQKIARLAAKLPFIPVFGDGKVKLYPIHVQDLNRIFEKILFDSSTNEHIYDIGSEKAITYNELYARIATMISNKPKLIHIPTYAGLLLAKVLSILPNPPIYQDNVLGSTQSTNCNPKPLLTHFNFHPIPIADGMNDVFQQAKKRICVVGLGKMGILHLSLLKTFQDVEVVALVDINPKLYVTVKSMGFSGKYYASFEDALKHERIHAVYITTPTFAHANILVSAMKKNIHVFVEKPVFLNTQQIDEVKKIKSNSIVHVGYTLLYTRTFQELQRIIKEHQYGPVESYEASFMHSEVLQQKKGWMFSKKLAGGGVMMNPGPHLFSILSACFGKPKSIDGTTKRIYSQDVEDQADFTYHYKNYEGSVFLSWSAQKTPISSYSVTVHCKNATIIATGTELTIQQKQKKKIFKEKELPAPIDGPIFNINPHAFGEAYYAENAVFVHSILDKKTHAQNTLANAILCEELIHRSYTAAEKQK